MFMWWICVPFGNTPRSFQSELWAGTPRVARGKKRCGKCGSLEPRREDHVRRQRSPMSDVNDAPRLDDSGAAWDAEARTQNHAPRRGRVLKERRLGAVPKGAWESQSLAGAPVLADKFRPVSSPRGPHPSYIGAAHKKHMSDFVLPNNTSTHDHLNRQGLGLHSCNVSLS